MARWTLGILAGWLALAGCSDDAAEGIDVGQGADAGVGADGAQGGDGAVSTGDAGGGDAGASGNDATTSPQSPAAALAGIWNFVSMTMVDGSGGTQQLSTDSSPESISGYTEITPTGDNTVNLLLFLETLTQGVPTRVPELDTAMGTVDETHYVIEMNPGEFFAYAYEINAGRVTFTRDRTHASDNQPAEGAPSEMVLDHVDMPVRDLVGAWQASSFTAGDGTTVDRGDCVTDGMSGYAKFSLDFAVENSHVAALNLLAEYFSDAQCMNAMGTNNDAVQGFVVEEAGKASLFAVAPSDPMASGQRVDFDVTAMGNGFLLTRTACLPTPSCETDAPMSITLVP